METSKRAPSGLSQSTLLPRVKAAARGRWLEIIPALASIQLDKLNGRKQPCPKCGGTDRFRAYRDFDQEGGCVCSQCHPASPKTTDGFATLSWLNGWTFPEALRAVAHHLRIEEREPNRPARPVPTPRPAAAPVVPAAVSQEKGPPPTPAQSTAEQSQPRIEFLPWNAPLAAMWCGGHAPIKPEALEMIGARFAKYAGLVVIAIPIWGERLKAAEPVNWLVYNAMPSGMVPTKEGPVKKKIIGGRNRGVIGLVDRLTDKSARKVKTEGPTDLLALLSADLATTDCVFTNAFGANEDPEHMRWLSPLVEDSICVTVHDQDQAGRDGLAKWSNFFAKTAEMSKAVTLPFDFVETHGQDLRDYFAGGASIENWQTLIEDSPAVQFAQPVRRSLEAIEDPHRLARENLKYYQTRHNGDLKFWRGSWLRWKKNRYKFISQDDMEAKVNLRIKDMFDEQWEVENREYEDWKKSAEFDPDEDKGPPVARKVNSNVVRDTLKAMRSQCLLSSEVELGTWIDGREKRKYLACGNGILDIAAFVRGDSFERVFLPHSSNWFSTSCLEYDFNLDAECPRWLQYIDQVTEGDQDKASLMQEFVGYVLSPDNTRSKFLALEGEGGNGKSVFINGIQAIIGQSNMSSVGLNELGERFKAFSTLGKMLNVCHEANDLDITAESSLKHFTGGDPMQFEQKGRDPIEMRPTAKILITWNEPPRFKDKTDALWRRMMIVRFTRKVENPDTRLLNPEYWYQQNEVAGMLNWALVGLQRLVENDGFTMTIDMRNAVEDVRVATNSARKFIKENYEYAPAVNGIASKIACKTLYKRYTEWCHEGNHKPFNEVHFGREMRSVFKTLVVRDRGMVDDFDGRVWCYFNVTERDHDAYERA